MDKILLKERFRVKALKKEGDEIKDVIEIWTSKEKTFRHEKY